MDKERNINKNRSEKYLENMINENSPIKRWE